MPVLVCLTGLPGVGKTTVARQVAQETGALWLWLDQIETAMRLSHMQTDDLADGGYAAAQAVAEGALRQGYNVIADCVNPLELTRRAWQKVSSTTGASLLEVELFCSDATVHQSRLENRTVELKGWEGPDWSSVLRREYEPLLDAAIRIDTAQTAVADSVERISIAIRNSLGEKKNV